MRKDIKKHEYCVGKIRDNPHLRHLKYDWRVYAGDSALISLVKYALDTFYTAPCVRQKKMQTLPKGVVGYRRRRSSAQYIPLPTRG